MSQNQIILFLFGMQKLAYNPKFLPPNGPLEVSKMVLNHE